MMSACLALKKSGAAQSPSFGKGKKGPMLPSSWLAGGTAYSRAGGLVTVTAATAITVYFQEN